jgi:type IV pilus assembly protein PilM
MARTRIPKPRLACEITPNGVIAARAKSDGSRLDVHTWRKLERDLVRPSLTPGNIADPAALTQTVEGALSAVGGRKRDVIAVLPDGAIRVLLLDFDTLPEKQVEADPIVRFRLRKSVPFDADHAALSFQSYRKDGGVKVLAAVCPREVLNEYESVIRNAGYEPGMVLPSTLAALSALEADRPTLQVKVDGNYMSIAIAQGNEVIFYRSLDVVPGRSGTDIANEVYPSIVFFEDNYSAKIERIFLIASSASQDIAEALEEQSGIRPESFESAIDVGDSLSGDGLPKSALAGIAGVLTRS